MGTRSIQPLYLQSLLQRAALKQHQSFVLCRFDSFIDPEQSAAADASLLPQQA